jgi:hypothetical protein
MTKRLREDDVPSEFICPITLQPMQDPVVTSDGHSYERSAIATWFNTHNTSPLTNKTLSNKKLRPNRALKALARRFYPLEQVLVLIPINDPYTKHEATYHIRVDLEKETIESIVRQLAVLVGYDTCEIRIMQKERRLKPSQSLSSLCFERNPELNFALHARLPWTMQIFVKDCAIESPATWTLHVTPETTIRHVMYLLSWKADLPKNCKLMTSKHRSLYKEDSLMDSGVKKEDCLRLIW